MHLIVFCDGTWNTPDQEDAGIAAPTNVVKLRNALAPSDINDGEQRVYYHPGVGTDGGWWNRVAGGGLGSGLDDSVVSAYNWLARNYVADAKIWLFGFSRGAYTVRSLGGMISRCGLLDVRGMDEQAIWDNINDLFAHYRVPEKDAKPLSATRKLPFHGVKAGSKVKHSIGIEFIGVWDTVGALGIPEDMAFLELIDDPSRHNFHDTKLSPIVANARHAVALDERRQSFKPTLWTDVEERDTVQQIWFPGVHGDVGGGYSRCGLSDGALLWMIGEAELLGLKFRQNVTSQLSPDELGIIHNSVCGVFKALKTRPRSVPLFSAGSSAIHKSGRDRNGNSPLAQGDYWKTRIVEAGEAVSVDVFAREKWNNTGIYLEQGVSYEFAASGTWIDGSIVCGPAGTKDGKFQLGEAVHVASSILGKSETIYKRLAGNNQVDFWCTRREEEIDWFALVGVIANGLSEMPQADAKTAYHEVFVIGSGRPYTPKKSGYLFAFANDAWQTYENNRGSVRLTVSR